MTFLKASRLPVLAVAFCLLLMGFAGTSYGAVRFDVVSSPTEVINTGLSEVTGSIKLIVRGTDNVTGTHTGGFAQIGIVYNSNGTFMPIDNTANTGIRIYFSSGFNSANPSIFGIANNTINGNCSGTITINLQPLATPIDGDYIVIDGVRGRIAASSGATQGNDLYVALQSINDPSANNFTPDSVRVAKSFPGMVAGVTDYSPLLCFPSTGVPNAGTATPSYKIVVTEGFARAFVDLASDVDDGTVAGHSVSDRVDTGGNPLGAPTNSTRISVFLSGIPGSVEAVHWDDSSTYTGANGTSKLVLVTSTDVDSSGDASAVYSYETTNQTDHSDISIEHFSITPLLELKADSNITGVVQAVTTLSPNGGSHACEVPGKSSSNDVRPRFIIEDQPSAPATYATIIRCNCFMLFTYVTSQPGYNTGIVVANTSQDYHSSQPADNPVFAKGDGAPNEEGPITFYFYSSSGAYRGYYTTDIVPTGTSFVALLSQMLGTDGMPDTTFTGYIIGKAEFQYCHAISYIADDAFAATAQGYAALIIPDPAILGNERAAADAGDMSRTPAGEGLNN